MQFPRTKPEALEAHLSHDVTIDENIGEALGESNKARWLKALVGLSALRTNSSYLITQYLDALKPRRKLRVSVLQTYSKRIAELQTLTGF